MRLNLGNVLKPKMVVKVHCLVLLW